MVSVSFSVLDSSKLSSNPSIALVLFSISRRSERISDTRDAWRVGVILRGSKGDRVSSVISISSSSVCPSGENAGVGRPGGEEGVGEESRRRKDGLDLDLDPPLDGARDLDLKDGAGEGWAMEGGHCKSAISLCECAG